MRACLVPVSLRWWQRVFLILLLDLMLQHDRWNDDMRPGIGG